MSTQRRGTGSTRRTPAAVAVGLTITLALALAGCGVADSQVGPSSAVDSSGEPESDTGTDTGTESPPDAEPAPQLDPDGTAEDNLAYFDDVNTRFLASDSSPGGRPIIDNLVAAGFDRQAMELTRDTTPIGREADSIQFSVRLGDGCLVGQASDSGYVGIVGPALAGPRCLIGELRPIDW